MQGYAEVFRDCAVRVLRKMADLSPRLGPIARITETRTRDSLTAIVGLQGDLVGSVALVMAWDVASRVAGRVAGEPLGQDAWETVRAIVTEMTNTLAGNATGLLLQQGVRENLTPPTAVEGPQAFFGFVGGIETFSAPLLTEEGPCAVIVSLQKGRPPSQA